MINWTPLKFKALGLQKTVLKKLKHRPQIGRKYLQITYLTKELYSKYIKNSQTQKLKKNYKLAIDMDILLTMIYK